MTQNYEPATSYWNSQWENEADRRSWMKEENKVLEIVSLLAEKKIKRILDLGAGVGRHALLFAQQGYETWAADSSEAGLNYIRAEAEKLKLEIFTEKVDIKSLPFSTGFFDFILSWNVLYHGNFSELKQAVDEVKRVLAPDGFFQGTFISKTNSYFGKGIALDSHTYICEDESDKSHPHCYIDESELHNLLTGFEIISLEDVEHDNYEGAFHFHVFAKKVGL